MGKYGGGSPEVGPMQHGRPEKRVEIEDVLADEMIELRGGIRRPKSIEIQPIGAAEILKTRHVADGSIQPDIKILARRAGNLETKIGLITGDIPVLKACVKPFVELVDDFGLQSAGSGPLSSMASKSERRTK